MRIYNNRQTSMQVWIEPLGYYVTIEPKSSVIFLPDSASLAEIQLETMDNGDLKIWIEAQDLSHQILEEATGKILYEC